MSHYNVKPVRLDFKASPLLAGILATAGLGAGVIVIFMPIAGWLKFAICPLVLMASAYHIADKALLRMPWSSTGLLLNDKGILTLRTRNGVETEICPLAGSFVASYLTIVNYRVGTEFRQRSVLLLPDNVDTDGFRQLRVWLRWGRQNSLGTATG